MKVERNFEKRHRLAREIIETVVLTILMFVIINLAVQNYDVDGPSMEATLHNQERIMVDKVSYRFHSPSRGDVIVFLAPPHPDLNYVKRIIAVPGDVVTIKKNVVTLNGVDLQEPYVSPQYQGNPYPDIVNWRIPDGKYFVMGDDRRNSSDSRDWGLLPRDNIIGRAALVYWPLGQDNNGFLANVSSVYAEADKRKGQSDIHDIPATTSDVPLPHANANLRDLSWHSESVNTGAVALSSTPLFVLGGLCYRRRKRRTATAKK